MEVQITGLRELVAALEKAESKSLDETKAVVEKGALNIKKDWAQRWSGHPHAPALSAAVNYDVRWGLGTINAEIGPDKSRRQGALGNIYEFGTPNNAPVPGGLPALEAEEPRFLKALEDMAEGLLGG